MKPYKTQIGSTQKTWIEAANIVNIDNILDCVILLNFFILCLLIPFQQDHLREGVNGKKTFSFGHCPNYGGGGLPMPEFFGPFSRSAFLVKEKSRFLQKCQYIEILSVFRLLAPSGALIAIPT